MSSYQAKFIRALPLHHTQREEVTTEEYSLFRSYYLCPHTYDFKQAILMLMAEAEVLEPQSLRNKIADIVHAIDKKILANHRKYMSCVMIGDQSNLNQLV